MDSTEFNKIAGGLIGAFLLLLLLNFAAGKIYGTAETHGHDEPLAFALEVESADEATAEAEPEATDYGPLIASADPANGEKVFKKCQSCHKIEEGANGVGPTLWGVVGRDIASVDGFSFTDALTGLEGDWTLTALGEFLKDPKGYAAGTKMSFAGIKDAQDRVDLIAYMNEADGTPIELVAAAPAAAEKPADEGAAHGDEKPAEDAAKDEAAAPADEKPADEAAAPADEKPADEGAEKPAEGVSTDEAAAPAEDKAAEESTDVAAADTSTSEAKEESGGAVVSAAFAGGDAAEGEKVFRKCKACHKIEEGKNGVGPHLWGIIGRDIASVDGFSYSPALQGMEGEWTASKLSEFLADPKGFAPGTKMALSGLKKEEDRVNIITYLNEADGTPDALQ